MKIALTSIAVWFITSQVIQWSSQIEFVFPLFLIWISFFSLLLFYFFFSLCLSASLFLVNTTLSHPPPLPMCEVSPRFRTLRWRHRDNRLVTFVPPAPLLTAVFLYNTAKGQRFLCDDAVGRSEVKSQKRAAEFYGQTLLTAPAYPQKVKAISQIKRKIQFHKNTPNIYKSRDKVIKYSLLTPV